MWLKTELHETWYYRDHNDDNDDCAMTDQGDNGLFADSATRGNGATGGLLDASHRSVVGGLSVERQENTSVVICVEHPQDGPPRELDNLRKRGLGSQT